MPEAFASAQAPRLRVALALRDGIAQGRFAPGSRLPTEQALTEHFGVSRPTVRAALALLQEEGLIRRDASRARRVADDVQRVGGALRQTVAILGNRGPCLDPHHKQKGWWGYVQASADEAVRRARRHTLLLDLETLDEAFLDGLVKERPAGLIVLREVTREPRGLAVLERLHQAGIPVVLCGHEPEIPQYDMVGSDHEAGGFLLTSWLLAHGQRRILQVWEMSDEDLRRAWVRQRQAGSRRALREAGREPLPLFRTPGGAPQVTNQQEFEFNARALTGYLLDAFRQYPDIDTIMVASDGLVFKTAAACRFLGRTPGQDLLVVGYDDYWQDCAERRFEAYEPPVTVDKRNPEIGRGLVQLLLERVAGHLGDEPCHRLIAPSLVETREA